MPLNGAEREREQDILDAYSLKQITRDETARLLADLYADHYDAYAALRLTDECNQTEPKGTANEKL